MPNFLRRLTLLQGKCVFFFTAVAIPNADILVRARAPTADLPNTAAFLGGMVAQESIKMITKQYVPVNGYCVIDLVDTWTGVIEG
jgi:hypothetical protein